MDKIPPLFENSKLGLFKLRGFLFLYSLHNTDSTRTPSGVIRNADIGQMAGKVKLRKGDIKELLMVFQDVGLIQRVNRCGYRITPKGLAFAREVVTGGEHG